MSDTPKLRDVVTAMERHYPRHWADDWDKAIGLVAGDPDAEVRRVHLAVDPTQAVVDEAVAADADLLITHHPLLFQPVSQVAADTPKGRVVHSLIRHGVGLYVAHTNADCAPHGVSQSMAEAIGLVDVVPFDADDAEPQVKVVTFVPRPDTERVIDAMAAAGAGSIGDYDRCAFTSEGTGTFRPGEGADPHIGSRGHVEHVDEHRVEMVASRRRVSAVVEAAREAHPYEEVPVEVYPLQPGQADRGTGRLGHLAQAEPLVAFVDRVNAALPQTTVGARVAGDPDATVETVALVGGAGDFMLDAALAAGVDAYVTSDLRHHPVSELREHPGAPAVVDVPHFAAEWTWLPVLRRVLTDELAERDLHVTCEVSTLCTDPWNYRAPDRASER